MPPAYQGVHTILQQTPGFSEITALLPGRGASMLQAGTMWSSISEFFHRRGASVDAFLQ